jgi:hypothetical protein
MWNIKCFIILVIIGATGIVSKCLKNTWKQYQDKIQNILYKTMVISHRLAEIWLCRAQVAVVPGGCAVSGEWNRYDGMSARFKTKNRPYEVICAYLNVNII